jgi:dihydrodipicolinate synthase/N-acetylneuraminate lyase
MTDFSGLFVATLTPFDTSDRVDYGVLRAHTDFLVQNGVCGICPAGTTGEFLYLSVGEKVRIVEEAAAAANGRVKVIAGAWALTAKEIALLARAAESAGADAVFLPPPIYYPADDEVIYRHYAAAHAATELPVFAYNIPSYAANALSLECLERLVNDGVIAGVKDSSAKAERMQALVERFGARIAVEAASDSFATEGRKLGAHGFISALANIWPRAFARLWEGDESLQPAIDAVRTAVKQAGGIPATKYLASKRGIAFGPSRLPFSYLTDERKAGLDSTYQIAVEQGME